MQFFYDIGFSFRHIRTSNLFYFKLFREDNLQISFSFIPEIKLKLYAINRLNTLQNQVTSSRRSGYIKLRPAQEEKGGLPTCVTL